MKAYRWSELRVGMTGGFTVTVTPDMMEFFRVLSGDCNPLHRDPAFALAAGHPGIVVFGLLMSAFYSRLVGVHLPGRFALLHGLDVDFIKPVYVGEPLDVSGEIVQLAEAYRQIQVRARILDGSGQIVSRAKIRVGLHEH